MGAMSSVLPPLPLAASPRRPLPRWTREPLLHFLLLGALLFGVDHLLNRRTGDANEIVVTAEVDEDARQLFKATRNREPSADEMAALRKVWLDNEVLYREGLALQLDKGEFSLRADAFERKGDLQLKRVTYKGRVYEPGVKAREPETV